MTYTDILGRKQEDSRMIQVQKTREELLRSGWRYVGEGCYVPGESLIRQIDCMSRSPAVREQFMQYAHGDKELEQAVARSFL